MHQMCRLVDLLRSLRSRSVQLAAASCRTPVVGSHPPTVRATCEKKSPYFRTSSFLNMAVRGRLTRFARPAGSPLSAFAVCPTGCRQLSNPGRGFSSPHSACNMQKKSPYFRTSSFSEYGGEGGIRTPDTLPYTHFPGVLLQPLGHLTILSFQCCWNGR